MLIFGFLPFLKEELLVGLIDRLALYGECAWHVIPVKEECLVFVDHNYCWSGVVEIAYFGVRQ